MREDTVQNSTKPCEHGPPEAMHEDDEEEILPPPHPPAEGGEVDADEITAKQVFHYPFELDPNIRINEVALLRELNPQPAIIDEDFSAPLLVSTPSC